MRVAAAQIAPVFLDRSATLEEIIDWDGRASDGGTRLVVSP
jgi:predicted amidohydrolase